MNDKMSKLGLSANAEYFRLNLQISNAKMSHQNNMKNLLIYKFTHLQ